MTRHRAPLRRRGLLGNFVDSARKALYTAWVQAGSNVIAHVGAESVVEARDLAAYAAKAGVKAIGVMPPTFFKPASAASLAATVASVCSAAPNLPCYYYHIPSMTGVDIDMLDFVVAIEALSDSFAGIKYTGMFTGSGLRGAHAAPSFFLCGACCKAERTVQRLQRGRFTIDVTGLSGRPLYSRSKSKFCADVSKYATR